MYNQVKEIEAKHGSNFKTEVSNMLSKERNNKPFDSAEWAMQQERERKAKEAQQGDNDDGQGLSDVEEEGN